MSTATTHIKTEKQLVPALRFKDFEGEWNFFKLEEIVDKKISYGIVQAGEHIDGGMPYIKSKDINGPIKLDTLERTSNEIAKKYIRSEVTPGDIIFSLRGNIGISQILPDSIKVANLTQGTARISVSNNYANYFVYQSLHTLPVIKRIFCVSKGSTFQEISLADLRNVKIVSPTLPEQQKIASFLSAVDEKIQQLTKKKALLEHYKKGVMQQLFSGQLRFKDENGNDYPDWEEKRLGEVGRIVTGSTPQTSIVEYYNGNKLFVSPADMGDTRYIERTKTTLTELGFKKGRKITKGAVLFVCIGSTIGKIAQAGHDCITNQQINAIIANEGFSNEFIYSLLVLFGGRIKLMAGVQAVPQINKTDFSKFKYMFPSLPEQQKIANYLSSIDTKIESVNNQITQTQTFKKGLLQGMFV